MRWITERIVLLVVFNTISRQTAKKDTMSKLLFRKMFRATAVHFISAIFHGSAAVSSCKPKQSFLLQTASGCRSSAIFRSGRCLASQQRYQKYLQSWWSPTQLGNHFFIYCIFSIPYWLCSTTTGQGEKKRGYAKYMYSHPNKMAKMITGTKMYRPQLLIKNSLRSISAQKCTKPNQKMVDSVCEPATAYQLELSLYVSG